MRYFTFIFSVWLLLSWPGPFAWGEPASWPISEQQLERQISTQIQEQAAAEMSAAGTGRTTRQQRIVAALDRVRLKAKNQQQTTALSWDGFINQNLGLTSHFENRYAALQDVFQFRAERN